MSDCNILNSCILNMMNVIINSPSGTPTQAVTPSLKSLHHPLRSYTMTCSNTTEEKSYEASFFSRWTKTQENMKISCEYCQSIKC